MKTYEVTVTSKNQITIPAEVVRKLNMRKNRVLHLEVKGGSIILSPEQEILEVMSKYWKLHKAKRGLSDEKLRDAVRTSIAENVLK